MHLSRPLVSGLLFALVGAKSNVSKKPCTKRSLSSPPPVTECTATVLVSYITQIESASGYTIVSIVTHVETTTPGIVVTTVTATETLTAVSSHLNTETLTLTETSSHTSIGTDTATETATDTATETITATSTLTEVTTLPVTTTATSIITEVTTSPVTETSTVTSTTTETTTTTTETIATATAKPLSNGNFEDGTFTGWDFISRTSSGDTVSVVNGGIGGTKAFSISTSYFIRSAAAAVSYGQFLNCVAGAKYRLTFDVSVISSYTNNSPWSVSVGTTTGNVYSGTGGSLAWTSAAYVHTCATTTAENQLRLSVASNNNRAVTVLFDNFALIALSVPN